MIWYLARHGETEWNRDGRMQGRLGGPLTERGYAQARLLGQTARALGVRHIIASPLPRALETAQIVGAAAGIVPVTLEALMETDFGQCGGMREVDIEARFPGLRAAREQDKWNHRWPDGESYADMAARIAPLREQLAPGTLVIAHQSINRVITHELGPASIADVLKMAQPSDVMLRFGDGEIAHGQIGGDAIAWQPGLYFGSASKLN
ncbi:MAG TPA: histidine phosphatase family protein [Polyangia bacterium]|jgi:probable phosphoglycerate mutase|nr:histidine phosphatase family protein [Polyangia bacterium]